jgi:hypothetical protein
MVFKPQWQTVSLLKPARYDQPTVVDRVRYEPTAVAFDDEQLFCRFATHAGQPRRQLERGRIAAVAPQSLLLRIPGGNHASVQSRRSIGPRRMTMSWPSAGLLAE